MGKYVSLHTAKSVIMMGKAKYNEN